MTEILNVHICSYIHTHSGYSRLANKILKNFSNLKFRIFPEKKNVKSTPMRISDQQKKNGKKLGKNKNFIEKKRLTIQQKKGIKVDSIIYLQRKKKFS